MFYSTVTPQGVLPHAMALSETVHLTTMHFGLILFIALSHKVIYINLFLLLRKPFFF